MGRLRAAHKIIDSQLSSNAGTASVEYRLGEHSNLTLLFDNTHASNVVTFQVQVASGEMTSGVNAVPAASEWYPLLKDDTTSLYSFDVAGSTKRALNLSPTGASWVRVIAISKVGGSHATVNVWAQSV